MFRVSPSAAVPHFALPPARASLPLISVLSSSTTAPPRRSCPRTAIAPMVFPLRSGMVAGEASQDLGVPYCLKYCRPGSFLLVRAGIHATRTWCFFESHIGSFYITTSIVGFLYNYYIQKVRKKVHEEFLNNVVPRAVFRVVEG